MVGGVTLNDDNKGVADVEERPHVDEKSPMEV